MEDEMKQGYGYSTDMFVTCKANGESVIVGGTSADTSRWIRILSHRAAQLLLSQMTKILHPEKVSGITGAMMTAPMRDANRPTITTHMDVDKLTDEDGFNITGWAGDKRWDANLTPEEVERFWMALSNALNPNDTTQ